jgi:integrase
MAEKLTDKVVKALPTPAKGNRITYDADVKGFGVRVTAAGGRAFVLNYRRKGDGLERRWTIGGFPDWTTGAVRDEAKRLKRVIDAGGDPVGEHRDARGAPTVNDLCERFVDEYFPRLRASTAGDYETAIRLHIRPALGRHKVSALKHEDIAALHRKISTTAGHQANRVVAVLSRMLSLAIKWGWRADNPAKGTERNPEEKRHRYLSAAELDRLTTALAEHSDRQAADIFRLLLLTGARRGEVQSMKWPDLELEAGTWTKPGATTKQRTLHRVPLSAPAGQLLVERKAERGESEYVFPGRLRGHRVEIKAAWTAICKAAKINDLRIHDLRHSYASQLVSAGFSLPTVGALLGHTQPATTHRYAHLADDPLRQATERVGAVIAAAGKPRAQPAQ